MIRACVSSGGIVPKYGRSQQSCQDILNTARMLGLQVTGMSLVENGVFLIYFEFWINGWKLESAERIIRLKVGMIP